MSIIWPIALPSIKVFFNKKENIDNWKLTGYQEQWLVSGAESLALICEIEQIRLNKKINILIPSYFCGQSLKHLRDLGNDIIFYNVNKDLSPDYKKLDDIVKIKKVDIMLQVHYFGKIMPQENSRDFCDKNNIVLVEDCAHVIHPSISNKWVGDYLFFSLHKHFPVKNGGILYSKNNFKHETSVHNMIFPYVWYIKNIARKTLLSFKKLYKTSSNKVLFSNIKIKPKYKQPSLKELNYLNNLTKNLNEIIEIKRQNFKKLREFLESYKGWSSLVNFKKEDLPYVMGMKCHNNNIMQKRFKSLYKQGCPVMIWPDLPVELKKDLDKYSKDVSRVKNTIFFFLHYQLDIDKYMQDVELAMNNQFKVKEITDYAEWTNLWKHVTFANLMQSWEYGEAKRIQKWEPFRFLILDEDDNPIAMFQVLHKGLPLIGGVARINRGPIYFQDFIDNPLENKIISKIFTTIKILAKQKKWWYVSFSPELADSSDNKLALESIGIKQITKQIPHGSIRLYLNTSLDDLFMGLKSKWRNLLRKAQKLDFEVVEVLNKEELDLIIDTYIKFQEENKFTGIPKKLLVSMLSNQSEFTKYKVYKTSFENKLSGFVFIAYHGDTATYLIGWTSYEGRKQNANYILLWNAICQAKELGLKWFDMGGVNENTPKGIRHFKNGVQGVEYNLCNNIKI